jgi:hypothetical protein
MWLEHFSMDEFVERYEPMLEQLLRAMERVETKSPQIGLKLSMEITESWRSGRFSFDYGIRKSMDVDDIYWGSLHREGDGVLDDDDDEQKELDELAEAKMNHLKAYDKGCKERGYEEG